MDSRLLLMTMRYFAARDEVASVEGLIDVPRGSGHLCGL